MTGNRLLNSKVYVGLGEQHYGDLRVSTNFDSRGDRRDLSDVAREWRDAAAKAEGEVEVDGT